MRILHRQGMPTQLMGIPRQDIHHRAIQAWCLDIPTCHRDMEHLLPTAGKDHHDAVGAEAEVVQRVAGLREEVGDDVAGLLTEAPMMVTSI